MATMHIFPIWLTDLEEEELFFMKKFILSSGSLKEMAKQYEVTYPTVRLRLDKLIQKIEEKEKGEGDAFEKMIQKLALEEKMSAETAKMLIVQYRKQQNGFC